MIYPKSLQKLIELLTKLPGIGPRQAARFAFFVLRENGNFARDLSAALQNVQSQIVFCTQCFRSTENSGKALCNFCGDLKRDMALIAVVEKESDMQNLEKTGIYGGVYHVLGGVISPFDQDSPKKIHLKELYTRVSSLLGANKKCEVVLATNPTSEGDTTALYIERVLAPLQDKSTNLKISKLGRGLSLGSELEHVDEITLKNAFKNRN